MKPNNRILTALLASLALASSVASAALTAYDGFDYGGTGGDLTGENGGTGWGGAYTDSGNSTIYSTTGLNYTGLATTGGASNTNDGSGTTTLNFRNTGTYSSGETWISFLVQQNGTPDFSLFAGISLYSGATGEVSFASHSTGVWRIVDLGVPSNVGSSLTTVSIAQDTTYLLVAQIAWGAGTTGGNEKISLWVNPTIGGSLGTANAVATDVDMTNFNAIRIAGQNAVDYTFDEIRIGDSFASVTIPEPSATLLGFLGALLLLRRRR